MEEFVTFLVEVCLYQLLRLCLQIIVMGGIEINEVSLLRSVMIKFDYGRLVT
jgi:hypothetical protein